jgi:hypothetical protein
MITHQHGLANKYSITKVPDCSQLKPLQQDQLTWGLYCFRPFCTDDGIMTHTILKQATAVCFYIKIPKQYYLMIHSHAADTLSLNKLTKKQTLRNQQSNCHVFYTNVSWPVCPLSELKQYLTWLKTFMYTIKMSLNSHNSTVYVLPASSSV